MDVWNIHAYVLNEASCDMYPDNCWGAGIPAGLADTVGLYVDIHHASQNANFSNAQYHLVALRAWMAQHGQQNKPLIITEMGVNFPPQWCLQNGECPFTPQQVRDRYMYPALVISSYPRRMPRPAIRWMNTGWFSAGTGTVSTMKHPGDQGEQEFNGNLFWSGFETAPRGLSTLGSYYQQYVRDLPNGSAKPY